jgi:hypothetical protein
VDAVGERDASQRVCGLFEKRDAICMSLEPVRQGLSSQIDAIVRVIKGHPEQ